VIKSNSCIVVTGANGLAGSAVVDHLKKAYTCVVPVTRGVCDLKNHGMVAETFRRIGPEYVFHAAATVYGLGGNMRNQGKSFLENTLINTAVIDAAQKCGVKKFIAMGTNAVYPWPPVLPYREETIFDGRPHDGEAGYGHAKRHMLAMLEAYNESYGMDYTYLVSGNLFGPRDTFDIENGHVLPSLIAKFYEASQSWDELVSVWGDGSPTRDFMYSLDLARIVRMVLENDTTGAINIGSGDRRSIDYVCRRLCSISGVDYDRVRYDKTKPNGRPDCYADLSKLRAAGFSLEWGFDEALKSTYKWFAASQAA
jgi:GDP-L-fucose synthase